jgi:hypothetical protein
METTPLAPLLVPNLLMHDRCVLNSLYISGVPRIAIVLASLAFGSGLVSGRPQLDGVEYFSGAAAVTTALQTRGYLTYPYELETDRLLHDILGDAGFAHAVALLLRTKPGGIAWFSFC